jgi:hypothetical protein
MRRFFLVILSVVLAAGPALAEPQLEAGDPLAPCLEGAAPPQGIAQPSAPWGVQIASSFSKQEALDEFSRVKKQHSDLLEDYSPTVVAVCALSMGTDLRYSVRIVLDKRDAADKLCNKLQAAGAACIVLKN